MKSVILCLGVVFQIIFAEELPSGFKRCSSKDTACLKEAIQDALPKLANGIKELGVPSLDPMKISKVTVGSGKIVQLVQNYEKVELTGLSQAIITDVSLDLDKGKMIIKFDVPELYFKGQYSVKGKILVLDVFGNGACEIRLSKNKGQMDMDIEKYDKNGETYIKATKSVYDLEPENMHFQFDNLFNGNKQLGDNINNVINDNWREIYSELKVDYLRGISRFLMRLSNKLFEKIPMKYIFTD